MSVRTKVCGITRAKDLEAAVSAGADAVKFQCFTADRIVSKEGFNGLKAGFQSRWKKSVYEVYKGAEFPRQWHNELFHYATKKGIHFFTSPYDKEAVDKYRARLRSQVETRGDD